MYYTTISQMYQAGVRGANAYLLTYWVITVLGCEPQDHPIFANCLNQHNTVHGDILQPIHSLIFI